MNEKQHSNEDNSLTNMGSVMMKDGQSLDYEIKLVSTCVAYFIKFLIVYFL